MLVEDDIGEHDIADAAVERGGLAEDVDAADLLGRHRDLGHEMIGGQAERVVDVDDDRVGCREGRSFRSHMAERGSIERDVELAEVDDLDADIDRAGGDRCDRRRVLLPRGTRASRSLSGLRRNRAGRRSRAGFPRASGSLPASSFSSSGSRSGCVVSRMYSSAHARGAWPCRTGR